MKQETHWKISLAEGAASVVKAKKKILRLQVVKDKYFEGRYFHNP